MLVFKADFYKSFSLPFLRFKLSSGFLNKDFKRFYRNDGEAAQGSCFMRLSLSLGAIYFTLLYFVEC